VVIPPQAEQSLLLTDLHANGVQVTGALPQR